jgi:hypothetical protein
MNTKLIDLINQAVEQGATGAELVALLGGQYPKYMSEVQTPTYGGSPPVGSEFDAPGSAEQLIRALGEKGALSDKDVERALAPGLLIRALGEKGALSDKDVERVLAPGPAEQQQAMQAQQGLAPISVDAQRRPPLLEPAYVANAREPTAGQQALADFASNPKSDVFGSYEEILPEPTWWEKLTSGEGQAGAPPFTEAPALNVNAPALAAPGPGIGQYMSLIMQQNKPKQKEKFEPYTAPMLRSLLGG